MEFRDGRKIDAEMSIVFPNWKPHDFLKGLPISDEVGFVITDMKMRNPDHPEIFACGNAAAITVPKLGAIGHQECEIVGKQIAKDVGKLSAEKADARGCLHLRYGRWQGLLHPLEFVVWVRR